LNKKVFPHLALLGTNIFFAINFSAIKHLIENKLVLPFGLNLARMLGATALLWILYILKPNKQPIKKWHYSRFFWCSILGVTINQLFFIKGLSMTHTIHASLLMLTTPIIITVIAAWILKERLTWNKIIGLILGVGGASVLILSKKINSNGMNVLLGDFLIIVNAICYSYYFILVKPLMKRYDPLTVLRVCFTLGTIIALPFCFSEFSQIPWVNYDAKGFILLITVVVGGTFLAYLFNIYGIKHLGTSVSGAYIYFQPVFATLISMFFMGEKLDWFKAIAAICIFAGVFIINKSAKADAEDNYDEEKELV
jgi:drug/metabolite transporter (DMT)-like permease